MNKILAITLTFVSLMLLTSCGIKGPLYIEEPTAKQTVSTIPTSTSSSSSDADDAITYEHTGYIKTIKSLKLRDAVIARLNVALGF